MYKRQTLTYENGKINLRRMESLCKVLSDLQNYGREIILVTSGAIGVGVGKLGLTERPQETEKKQALAAVGQCELMFMYDKFFGEYNRTVAQVLLTGDVVSNPHSKQNVVNTFQELIGMQIIPVVNENDTVAVDELDVYKRQISISIISRPTLWVRQSPAAVRAAVKSATVRWQSAHWFR